MIILSLIISPKKTANMQLGGNKLGDVLIDF